MKARSWACLPRPSRRMRARTARPARWPAPGLCSIWASPMIVATRNWRAHWAGFWGTTICGTAWPSALGTASLPTRPPMPHAQSWRPLGADMDQDFNRDIEALSKHYSGLVKRHGDAPESAQYADRETQERRMAVLCETGVTKDSKLLDFGCGTGQLLSFLQRSLGYHGEYVGYDISPEAIELARSTHPTGRFEVRNILEQPAEESFDY